MHLKSGIGFMEIIKKYLFVLMGAFLISGQVVAGGFVASAQNHSPEVEEFKRLAGKVLSSKKASAASRFGLGFIKEFLKIGGSISLFTLADNFSRYEGKDFAADGVDLLFNSLLKFKFSPEKIVLGEKYRRSQIAPIVCVVAAMFFVIFCDALIYKRDKTVAAIQMLQEYVESLSYKPQRSVAKIFKEEYERPLYDKIVKDLDDVGFKMARAELILFDLFLPLIPLVFFGAMCGWDLNYIKRNLNIIMLSNKFAGPVTKFMGEDVKLPAWRPIFYQNIYVLAACVFVFALNLPMALYSLPNSSDRRKELALLRIKKTLG